MIRSLSLSSLILPFFFFGRLSPDQSFFTRENISISEHPDDGELGEAFDCDCSPEEGGWDRGGEVGTGGWGVGVETGI